MTRRRYTVTVGLKREREGGTTHHTTSDKVKDVPCPNVNRRNQPKSESEVAYTKQDYEKTKKQHKNPKKKKLCLSTRTVGPTDLTLPH